MGLHNFHFSEFYFYLGFGLSCIQMCVINANQLRFDKHRALAQGIIFAGNAFGKLIWSPLAEWLISMYGWRGTFLIISGIQLNGLAFGLLVVQEQKVRKIKIKIKSRPQILTSSTNPAFDKNENADNEVINTEQVSKYIKKNEYGSTLSMCNEHNRITLQLRESSSNPDGPSFNQTMDRSVTGAASSGNPNAHSIPSKDNELSGLEKYKSVLSNPLFLVYILSYTLGYMGGLQPTQWLPTMGIQVGMTFQVSALLLSIMGKAVINLFKRNWYQKIKWSQL